LNPSHTQLRVYNGVGIGIWAHLARSHLMLQSSGHRACGTLPILV
jgi:hypothetical protein